MTVLDANILLYAYNPDSTYHDPASRWVDELFRSSEPIGLCWPTLWAFLRVGTNPRAGGNDKTAPAYFAIMREWLQLNGVVLLHPGPRHFELLERMVVEGKAFGPMLSDAVLAALAIENGAILASTDRHFSRFPGLKWVNPLD